MAAGFGALAFLFFLLAVAVSSLWAKLAGCHDSVAFVRPGDPSDCAEHQAAHVWRAPENRFVVACYCEDPPP